MYAIKWSGRAENFLSPLGVEELPGKLHRKIDTELLKKIYIAVKKKRRRVSQDHEVILNNTELSA